MDHQTLPSPITCRLTFSLHRIYLCVCSPTKKRPDGGSGGDGGSVYLIADEGTTSLNLSTLHYNGKNGSNGSSKHATGRNGSNVYVRVPVGSIVTEIAHEPSSEIFDWDDEDEEYSDEEGDGEFEEDDELQGKDGQRKGGKDGSDWDDFDDMEALENEQELDRKGKRAMVLQRILVFVICCSPLHHIAPRLSPLAWTYRLPYSRPLGQASRHRACRSRRLGRDGQHVHCRLKK